MLVKQLALFISPKKQLDRDFKIKQNGKRLYKIDSANCLGIQIDKSLTWKNNIIHVAIKLNKVNAILSKSKHVLNKEL